jgi:2-C-methyl-D-erythritol 4-phosphate cytidylyltransferase
VSLAINAGCKVKMVKGEYSNIKITTKHDYLVAQGMIKTEQ